MQDILVVVDMQNDFIDGALGTKEAVTIVPKVEEKIRNFKGTVLFTRDTHETWYLDTQEGKKLPVSHCIRAVSYTHLVGTPFEYVSAHFRQGFVAEETASENVGRRASCEKFVGNRCV